MTAPGQTQDLVFRPTVDVGGAFSLVDHFGEAVTEASWPGRFLLIFFGFSHCKVVCPRALAKLEAVIGLLGEDARRLRPLYISVDPARDTPQRLRDFLRSYPHFLGLTGTSQQIEAAKTAYRAFAQRREGVDGDYDMPHSALIYLVEPSGRLAAHYVEALEPDVLARRIAAQLNSTKASDRAVR